MAAKHTLVTIKNIKEISSEVFLFILDAPLIAAKAKPGQFIHIKIPGVILRRPLSIHDVRGGDLYILFRVRGKGTKLLSAFKKGSTMDIIGPLGNGFNIDKSRVKNSLNIMVAGGIGVAPIMFLARSLAGISNKPPVVLIGAKHRQDIFAVDSLKKAGCKVFIATDDGSMGKKGNTVDLLKDALVDNNEVNLFACGPEVMFKAINHFIGDKKNITAQVSFEQFMGCGIGTCCGCTINTKHGYKKVCKDGPVFNIHDVF